MHETQWPLGSGGSMLLALILLVSCNEAPHRESTKAIEEINDESYHLVQVVETSKGEMRAKYLTPNYLALSEMESEENDLSFDSLVSLYSTSLSFYVTLDAKEETSLSTQTMYSEETTQSGLKDVEADRYSFQLSDGDHSWYPVAALPELRVGEAEQTWMVVFAIDPTELQREKKHLILTYTDPVEGEVSRFTYNVADLLHPDFIARIN